MRSRFSVRIDFPRYTADQLVEIARRMVRSRGDHVTPDALTAVLDQICANGRIDELGNAQFVRNALKPRPSTATCGCSTHPAPRRTWT